MGKQVSWGIVGAGAIAQRFASDLLRRPDARLTAVAARREPSAQAFAQAFGVPNAHTGVEALAARSDVDIVYIATPNADHLASALACIAARKAVLIEKPIAVTAQQARTIAVAAAEAGVFCMEAMWMRFTPGVVRAKAMIEAGEIGEALHLDARLFYPQALDPADRFHDPALGGGVLLDLGVYPVSLALHLFGRPGSVTGATLTGDAAVERQAAMALAWPGRTATLACGFTGEGDNAAVVVGSRGHLHLHRQFICPPFLTRLRTDDPAAAGVRRPPRRQGVSRLAFAKRLLQPLDPRRTAFAPTPFEGFGLGHQVAEAHRCLAAGLLESPVMPLAESVAVLEVLEQVGAS
ncbi:MAG TPA: Gfo/Idh/MocA family oxidoreductase [Phenylobacterium sp.]|uniref:Gfo/Idh/MocA family protein n=1 Tax=Phenylobacterium sp. TaxID=1871053 RepID=UPI002B46942D|nr:Gfo/Idh/MocA family oxidoreductase [Phenylobacterium sp.]HKR88479.1 Gfo/Idh/MocA family oxidoreductase [Phenylobacterium sp.]